MLVSAGEAEDASSHTQNVKYTLGLNDSGSVPY